MQCRFKIFEFILTMLWMNPFLEAFTVKVWLVSPRAKDHNVSYFDQSFCTPTHTIRASSDTDITEGVDETKIKRAMMMMLSRA